MSTQYAREEWRGEMGPVAMSNARGEGVGEETERQE